MLVLSFAGDKSHRSVLDPLKFRKHIVVDTIKNSVSSLYEMYPELQLVSYMRFLVRTVRVIYIHVILTVLKKALMESSWYKRQPADVQSKVSWKLYEQLGTILNWDIRNRHHIKLGISELYQTYLTRQHILLISSVV
jgi:hypothetical protein